MQKNANFDGYGKQGSKANLTPLPSQQELTSPGSKIESAHLWAAAPF